MPIITLANYTEQEIEMYKFPIPGKQSTKVKKWLKQTGGIAGKAYGLEADAMPRERVKRLVRQVLAELPS